MVRVDKLWVELGSGRNSKHLNLNNWVTIDSNPKSKATHIQEIPPLPKEIKDVDIFRGNHFWEHLYIWQANELARELYEALKPNGQLVLELPNLAKACEFLLADEPDVRKTWWAIYGAQEDPTWSGDISQAHKWGYTPESITKQLREAGFEHVDIRRAVYRIPERDMRVVAFKRNV